MVVVLAGFRLARRTGSRPTRLLAATATVTVLVPVLYELFGSLAVRLPAGY